MGSRLPATVGLALQAAGCLVLADLTTTSSYPTLLAGLLVLGLGAGSSGRPTPAPSWGRLLRPARGGERDAGDVSPDGMVTSYALARAVAAAAIPARQVGEILLGSSVQLGAPVMSAFTIGMTHALAVSAVIVLAAGLMTFIAGDTARARRTSPQAS